MQTAVPYQQACGHRWANAPNPAAQPAPPAEQRGVRNGKQNARMRLAGIKMRRMRAPEERTRREGPLAQQARARARTHTVTHMRWFLPFSLCTAEQDLWHRVYPLWVRPFVPANPFWDILLTSYTTTFDEHPSHRTHTHVQTHTHTAPNLNPCVSVRSSRACTTTKSNGPRRPRSNAHTHTQGFLDICRSQVPRTFHCVWLRCV